MKEDVTKEMATECEKLFKDVTAVTEKAGKKSENLQKEYDGKLDKIKNVCAEYFSKYEKHLFNQQDIVKTLEKRQEDWINTLIKPQEVNQARLFSIDTRLKEGELQRLNDMQFLRDTTKKFIYAVE